MYHTQEDRTLFKRMVGSLLYLANGIQPDISYPVTIEAWKMKLKNFMSTYTYTEAWKNEA